MDLYEIRRRRVRQLIKERFGGFNTHFASMMEWPPTDVSRFFVRGKHGRKISETKARAIERRCRLERYWLDQDQSAPLSIQQPLAAYSISEAEQVKLLDAYSYLTPGQQEDIINQMNAYRKANEAAVRHLGGRFKTVTKERAAETLPSAPEE